MNEPAGAVPVPVGPPTTSPKAWTAEELCEIVVGCASMRTYSAEIMERVPGPPAEEPPRRRSRRHQRPPPVAKSTGVYVFGLAASGRVVVEGDSNAAFELASNINQRLRVLMLTERERALSAITRPKLTALMEPQEVMSIRQALMDLKVYDRDSVTAMALTQGGVICTKHYDQGILFSGHDAKERVADMDARFSAVIRETIHPIQLAWQKRLAEHLPKITRA